MSTWHWQTQEEAPLPAAAVAWQSAAQTLHAHLLALPEARQAALRMIASQDVLIVLGKNEDLPWFDGIAYAAPSRNEPELWLPTTRVPSVPQDLLYQALLGRFRVHPLLLWPEPQLVIPLSDPVAVTVQALALLTQRWGRT